MAKEKQPTKVVTGKVRLSYLHVFEPTKMSENDEAKYSVSLLIPKKDKVTIAKIEKAIEAAKEIGKASKWGGKIPAKLKTPLRDGDEERPDDEAYAGCFFLNASAKIKPGIVKRDPDFADEPVFITITDPKELYSGCYGKASVNFYPFDTKGNKGVACGLNNIMKVEDGPSLGGGRSSAEDDFSEEEEDF